jgi:hypothetical protein
VADFFCEHGNETLSSINAVNFLIVVNSELLMMVDSKGF